MEIARGGVGGSSTLFRFVSEQANHRGDIQPASYLYVYFLSCFQSSATRELVYTQTSRGKRFRPFRLDPQRRIVQFYLHYCPVFALNKPWTPTPRLVAVTPQQGRRPSKVATSHRLELKGDTRITLPTALVGITRIFLVVLICLTQPRKHTAYT